MSTPEPTPPASPARKFGWVDFVFLALFVGAIAAVILWALSRAYASVVIDEEREPRPGVIVQSGRVYDQAKVELPPGVELVIPATRLERTDSHSPPRIEVKMRSDGRPGEVLVLIETRITDSSWPEQSRYLPRSGGGKTVWKRQTGTTLAIDVPPGFISLEYGVHPTVIFVVPPGQVVRQAPPNSPVFAGRGGDDEQSKAAGWEPVLTRPLSRVQFR